MAVTTTRQSGVSFVVHNDGTAVGGGTDATLALTVDMIDTTNKDSAQWMENLPGLRGWSLEFDGFYVESSAEISGAGATLDLDSYDLSGLRTFTANFTSTPIDASDEDAGLDRVHLFGDRQMSVDFEATYLDPLASGNNALANLVDAANGDSTNSFTLTLTFGAGQSIACTARVTDLSVGAPENDAVTVSGTLVSTGAVTITDTNADAAWLALVDDYTGGTSTTVTLMNDSIDDSEYEGSAYFTEFSITVPFEGAVTAAGTALGTGALTDQAQT